MEYFSQTQWGNMPLAKCLSFCAHIWLNWWYTFIFWLWSYLHIGKDEMDWAVLILFVNRIQRSSHCIFNWCFCRSEVLSWLPASALFVGIIYSGSRALSRLVRSLQMKSNMPLQYSTMNHSMNECIIFRCIGGTPRLKSNLSKIGYWEAVSMSKLEWPYYEVVGLSPSGSKS